MVPFYHFSNKTQFLTTETHKKNYIKTTTHKPNILYFDSSDGANSNANTWSWQIHHGRKNNSNLGDILANCDILKRNVWKTGLLLLIFLTKRTPLCCWKTMALEIPLESFHTGVFLYPLSIVYGRRGGEGQIYPHFLLNCNCNCYHFILLKTNSYNHQEFFQ